MALVPNQSVKQPAGLQIDDDRVFVKRYLTMFVSNWYWFAISLFISTAIAYGINRYSSKLYVVSSSLLIKDDMMGGGSSSTDNFIAGVSMFKNRQNLSNEIGRLKSFSLNKRVIDALPEFRIIYTGIGRRGIVETKMYKTAPFIVIPKNINKQRHHEEIFVTLQSDSSFLIKFGNKSKEQTTHNYGDSIVTKDYNFVINKRFPQQKFDGKTSNRYYFSFTEAEGLANNFRSLLSITPIDKEATLVFLSETGSVPLQLSEYLNKLMELYIALGLEDKNNSADSTLSFIDQQLDTISGTLTLAEQDLQDFRSKNKLTDIDREGILIQDKLKDLDKSRSETQMQVLYFNYLRNYIESKNQTGDIVSPSTMGITDEAVGRLAKDLATFQVRKNELLLNMSQDLPAVTLAEENIQATKAALQENIKSNLQILDSTMKTLDRHVAEVYAEMKDLPVTEREMIGIKRKFDVNNTIYTYLLGKRAETSIARASTVSDNRIIDEAQSYNYATIRPKKNKNNLKALFLGIFIPGLAISLLYYFNNTIMDNNDITDKTHVPIIGVISHNEGKKELPTVDNPKSALAESFRSVRTSLKYFIRDTNTPVIAVTSTISSEGKTFISVNLAAIMAQLGKKVLLIGLDLRKPRIHRILGVDNQQGMSNYLSSACEYEDVIKETAIKNLYYGQSGPIPPNPAELIEGDRMQEFLEKAKTEFDYIIIDTPPIAIVSDTLLLSAFVDVNIFVVRQRYSSKNTLELVEELYSNGKLKNMNIVINDINLSGYYGYGLRYTYNRGYGYSYGQYYYGRYSYGKYGYSDKGSGYYD
jgi:tyrosine-protein kinase Etk/Wzc